MASEPELTAAWELGRAAWPSVIVDRTRFADHVATKLEQLQGTELAHLDPSGLYLATAVVSGDPAAAREIASMMPLVEPALRKLGADPARLDDIRQRVLEVVVVGGERGPAIAGYAGRSDLRSWLRSIAVRTALKLWSRERSPTQRAMDDDLMDLADDPELAHLKAAHAERVSSAIRRALATLSPRARTLLRLHYLDGLTSDDIGRLYQIHRATAARWVASAREAVFDETRLLLEAELGLGEDSAVNIVRLVQSQLLLSMRRLLTSQSD